MAKRKPSSVEELRGLPPKRKQSWDEKLPPDVLADVLEVRAAIIAGEIKQSLRTCSEYLNKKHGLNVSYGSFQYFVERGKKNGSG